MNYKELLFNKDKVLSFYPELAVILNKYDKILAEEEYKNRNGTGKKRKAGTLGLNEAIIINQISYWNEINKKAGNNFRDGYYWTYNTYEKWAKNDFPYWSADTIRKSITALENMGIIVSTDKYNSYKIDNTKWYRVDYDKLQKIIDIVEQSEKDGSSERENEVSQVENENCGCVNVSYTDGLVNLNKPIPEITTDNTNKDYITDTTDNSFSKEKVNSNSPQGMCNSFSREKKDTRRPKQNKPLSEKELEQANDKMPYRASGIAYNLTGNRDLSNNVFKFFEYFLDERKKHTGKWHIPLSDTTLAKVVATLIEDIKVDRGDYEDTYFSLVIDELGNDDYKEVVDKYFKTKFKNKVDYSIVHFTQENVLINIMNHCGKENWCMSV